MRFVAPRGGAKGYRAPSVECKMLWSALSLLARIWFLDWDNKEAVDPGYVLPYFGVITALNMSNVQLVYYGRWKKSSLY